jgi:hypothetical protein
MVSKILPGRADARGERGDGNEKICIIAGVGVGVGGDSVVPPKLAITVPISFSRESVLAFAMGWSAPALFSPPFPPRAAWSWFLRRQGS